MNETDSPLKRLVTTSIVDFAEWILKTQVDHVEMANIELPADPAPIFSDLLFWVTLEEKDEQGDPIRVLLHFEFQGESTRKPMRFRMLDYTTRIADQQRGVRIHSVVFYIGDGVGTKDSGIHQIRGMGKRVTLAWHYDVIRLWDISPQALLDLKRPGLLPLIGQAKIEKPDEIIPQIYKEIKSVPSEETQHRLLTELLALLRDKEIVEMVETLIERDEWVLDTPYIRRWRDQVEEAQNQAEQAQNQVEQAQNQVEQAQNQVEQAQNQAEQIQSQFEQALSQLREAQKQIKEVEEQAIEAEKKAESRTQEVKRAEKETHAREEKLLRVEKEQWRETRREDILSIVAARYNPPLQDGLRLQKSLKKITNDERFSEFFTAVVQVPDFEQFFTFVDEVASSQNGHSASEDSLNGA